MTHARWWRDTALLVFAFGLVSGLAFIRMVRADGQFGWGEGVLLLMASAGGCALLSLPFVQRSYRADARLRKGGGALARWTLTLADWNQFVVAERERSARSDAPTNLVSTDRRLPSGGLEVIIGADAIIVGDEYHSLRALGRLGPGEPSWVSSPFPALEYHLLVTDSTDTLVSRVVRVPVAPNSQAAARALAKA